RMKYHLPLLASLGFVSACSSRGTRCEQIADEIRGMLEACGVTFAHYGDSLGSECSDSIQTLDECLLGCYQNGSCSEYLTDEVLEGSNPFRNCLKTCF